MPNPLGFRGDEKEATVLPVKRCWVDDPIGVWKVEVQTMQADAFARTVVQNEGTMLHRGRLFALASLVRVPKSQDAVADLKPIRPAAKL